MWLPVFGRSFSEPMDRKHVVRVFFLFIVSAPRSLASGADGKTSSHANQTLPHSPSTNEKLTVHRNEYVELGTDVILNCTSRKIAWDNIFFVIWKINSQNKECRIAMANNDSDYDTCLDGKKQNHTSDGTYQLIIPNFSNEDEGNYTCDISYLSGGSLEIISVSAWARPQVSGWLKNENGHTVAVCEATSKPAASIHWETPWNSSSPILQNIVTTGRLSKVISHFHIPQNASHRNVTCVAISNDLKHTKTKFNFNFNDPQVQWPYIVVGVCAMFVIVAILLFIMCKYLPPLSIFRKICCKPDIPTSNEEKPQQPYDPEELQPYASYVQRVNSIYNSSAELFKA